MFVQKLVIAFRSSILHNPLVAFYYPETKKDWFITEQKTCEVVIKLIKLRFQSELKFFGKMSQIYCLLCFWSLKKNRSPYKSKWTQFYSHWVTDKPESLLFFAAAAAFTNKSITILIMDGIISQNVACCQNLTGEIDDWLWDLAKHNVDVNRKVLLTGSRSTKIFTKLLNANSKIL